MAIIRLYEFLTDLFFMSIIPVIIILFWMCKIIGLHSVIIFLLGYGVILMMAIPTLFRYSYSFQRGFVFLHFARSPIINDLQIPSKEGLYATRNFYLTHNDLDEKTEVKLGVWHILPNHIAKRFSKQLKLSEKEDNEILDYENYADAETESKLSAIEKYIETINNQEDVEKALFEAALKTVSGTIFVYLHGNTASRGKYHRVELYRILQKMGYHVIAFDYRSFGDSSKPLPTEAGIVRDAIAVVNYISNLTENPVFIWGHSIGSGVSTHMLSDLSKAQSINFIKGVILESPFSSVRDEVRELFSKTFSKLPWFEDTIINPLYSNSLRFESTKHVSEFSQPVCILHAKDDMIVAFKLGYKLYRSAVNSRSKTFGKVEFHGFERRANYGHVNIYKAPNLERILRNFVGNYRNKQF